MLLTLLFLDSSFCFKLLVLMLFILAGVTSSEDYYYYYYLRLFFVSVLSFLYLTYLKSRS